MKKFVVIVAVCLACAGCSALFRARMERDERIYIGMTMPEFRELYPDATRLEMTQFETIYGVDVKVATDGKIVVTGIQLFYFGNDRRLFRMETRSVPPEHHHHHPGEHHHQDGRRDGHFRRD